MSSSQLLHYFPWILCPNQVKLDRNPSIKYSVWISDTKNCGIFTLNTKIFHRKQPKQQDKALPRASRRKQRSWILISFARASGMTYFRLRNRTLTPDPWPICRRHYFTSRKYLVLGAFTYSGHTLNRTNVTRRTESIHTQPHICDAPQD